jgi:hypothetical protein
MVRKFFRDRLGRFASRIKRRFRPSGMKVVYKRKFLAHTKVRGRKKWKWREIRITRYVSKKSNAPSESELRALVFYDSMKKGYEDPPNARSSKLEAYQRLEYTKKQAKREGLTDGKDYIEDYPVREEGY